MLVVVVVVVVVVVSCRVPQTLHYGEAGKS
jgi:hypothetical protein